MRLRYKFPFFFFNDTATTEIYTLSLHDALPISLDTVKWLISKEDAHREARRLVPDTAQARKLLKTLGAKDRKSTRLNSSHSQISYAVFCFKKEKSIPEYTQHDLEDCRPSVLAPR